MGEAAPAASATSGGGGIWVLTATVLGSSMAFIDGVVVNVALPVIQSRLSATTADMQWVVDAYLLTLGALMLLGGAAGDRWGRKRLFLWGTALFGIASLACALAPTAGWLIAARAVQGAAGALLVPASLAVLRSSFDGAARGRAIGTWAAFSALTTAAGPILGGWLVDGAGWRSIFLINLPVAAIAVSVGARALRESRDDAALGRRLDLLGAMLAAAGLALTSWGLIAVGHGGGGAMWLAVAAGVAVLALFVWWQGRAETPMLPLALFRNRTFAGTNLYTMLLYGALAAALFLQPFLYQQVWGWSATAAGAAFLPLSLTLGLLSRYAGGLAEQVGARPMLVAGALVTGLGWGWLGLAGADGFYWTDVFPGMSLAGLGMAAAVAPLTTAAMGSVEDRHAGTASGINNAAARVASLIAVAGLGAVAGAVFAARLTGGLADIDIPDDARSALEADTASLAAIAIPQDLPAATVAAVERIVTQAFLAGHGWTLWSCAGLCIAAAGVAWMTVPARLRAEAASAEGPDT